MRIGVQELLPHRAEINEMLCLAEVLLRGLNFGNDRSLFHRTKQRMKRLAWLKINRTVLHLQRDVGAELSVEQCELEVSPFGAIWINVFVINKRAPDDLAL